MRQSSAVVQENPYHRDLSFVPLNLDPQVYAAALALIRGPLPNLQPLLSSHQAVVDYLLALMSHSKVELFHVLYLDRKNRLIADETLQRGTVDHVPVYPREVAHRALLHHASSIVLAHNHPSGDPSPSSSDISMTENIKEALSTLGITLHDHIIVGHSSTYSLRANGEM